MNIKTRLILEDDWEKAYMFNIIKNLFTYTACLSYPAVRTNLQHASIYFYAGVLTLT